MPDNIKVAYDDFYHIRYDDKMYERFLKISKLSYTNEVKMGVYNDKIKKYMKIIKYSIKNKSEMKEIFAAAGAKHLAKDIDKLILSNAMAISIKKIMDDKD